MHNWFDDRFSRIDTIPACVGQTDRRTGRQGRTDRRPAYGYNVLSMTDAR